MQDQITTLPLCNFVYEHARANKREKERERGERSGFAADEITPKIAIGRVSGVCR